MSTITRSPRRHRAIRSILLGAALLGIVLLGAWAHAVGIRLTPVLSGSMRPSYAAGSLVATTETPAAALRRGDVIAFVPPKEFRTPSGRPVLHRVVTADVVDGRVVVTTRGDANGAPDPWTLDLTGARVHRARWSVPVVGRVIAGIVDPALAVRAASLAGAALVIGAVFVWRRSTAVERQPC